MVLYISIIIVNYLGLTPFTFWWVIAAIWIHFSIYGIVYRLFGMPGIAVLAAIDIIFGMLLKWAAK